MGPRTPGSTKAAARSLGHSALHSKRAGPVGPSLLGTQGRGQSHRPTWDDSQLCPWPPRKGHPGPTWAQPPARGPSSREAQVPGLGPFLGDGHGRHPVLRASPEAPGGFSAGGPSQELHQTPSDTSQGLRLRAPHRDSTRRCPGPGHGSDQPGQHQVSLGPCWALRAFGLPWVLPDSGR